MTKIHDEEGSEKHRVRARCSGKIEVLEFSSNFRAERRQWRESGRHFPLCAKNASRFILSGTTIHMDDPVPIHPDWKVVRLPNGLTLYVAPVGQPAGRETQFEGI